VAGTRTGGVGLRAFTYLRRLPRSLLIGLCVVVAAGSVVAAWGPLSRQVSRTAAVMVTAEPPMLLLAIFAGAAAVLATGIAWVVPARDLGSSVGLVSGSARYSVACLAPPKLGNPVRIALLGRTLPGSKRLWAMSGVAGAVSIMRMLPLSLVVVIAATTGAVPLWPGLVIAGAVLAVLAGVPFACRHAHGPRLQRLLAGFSLVGRSAPAAATAFAVLSVATLMKLVSAAATAAALGIPHPVSATLVLVPALAFGRMLPFLGVAAGTGAVAAAAQGVSGGSALSLAVAVAAVEGAAGIACGIAGAGQIVRLAHVRDWRRSLATIRSLHPTSHREEIAMGASCKPSRSQSTVERHAVPGWNEVEEVLDRLAKTGELLPGLPGAGSRIGNYQRDRRLMIDSELGSRWIALEDIRACWQTFERLGSIRRQDVLEPGRCSAFMMTVFAQVPGVVEQFDAERLLVLPA
jgi:hypothetical protein